MAPRKNPPRAVDIVKAFDQEWTRVAPICIDWGHPACFGCGYYSESWDDVAPWDEESQGRTPHEVLNQRWEKSSLQKAHLIGHQFNGPNTADNFAMLCRRCHIEAPDTPDAAVMVRWIERREQYAATLTRELMAAAPTLTRRWLKAGMPRPDLESVYMRGGVHFDPGFGATMSLSTLAAVAVEAIEAAMSREVPGQLRLA